LSVFASLLTAFTNLSLSNVFIKFGVSAADAKGIRLNIAHNAITIAGATYTRRLIVPPPCSVP
jgi:hypothetical protein